MKYEANLTVNISRQGKHYIVYCPALDISTSGKTELEAKKRFDELLPLFVEELERAGTTDDVLSELGWHKQLTRSASPAWQPPVYKSEEVSVRIPVAA